MANYYTYTLKANQPIQVAVSGKVILVDSIGVAPGLDITPSYQGQIGKTMPQRQTAFKVWVDYDTVTLAAPVDCNVALFLSTSDVSLGFTNGSSINVQGQVNIGNGPGARVPVDIGGGNVQVTAGGVTVGNADNAPVPVKVPAGATLATKTYQAQGITDQAPVAVGAAAGALLAADATRRGFRVKNVGANAVAIGGATVAYNTAAVLIQPGETWNETEAPGAAWFCICAAGLASTLNLQTIA